MTATIALHPVLNYFLSNFTTKHNKPSGQLVGNMDNFTLGQQLKLVGAYFVCAAKTKFVVSESILCTGPGGGLIAGRSVQLEGPEMELQGTSDEPVQIVAIDGLVIKSANLKIQNVAFYLFGNAQFSMDVSVFSEVKEVRIIRLNMENDTLIETTVVHWKDKDALREFMSRENAPKTMKGRDSLKELIERLELQREAVKKIGLRSILV